VSEDLYFDATFLLFPELKKTMESVLEETGKGRGSSEAAELARMILTRIDNLRGDMIAASSRMSGVPVAPEMREVSEVMRYGFTALKRKLLDGEDKYHVFFNELSYETRLYKSAFTSLMSRIAEVINGMSGRIVEINDPAPLLGVKAGFRTRSEVIIVDTDELYESDVVREIQGDYIKKYLVKGRVVRMDEASEYEGSVDLVIYTFIDAWRMGFDRLYAVARRFLTSGGLLAAVVPFNMREGLRTILRAWGVYEMAHIDDLRKKAGKYGFKDFRVRRYGLLAAITAIAK